VLSFVFWWVGVGCVGEAGDLNPNYFQCGFIKSL